MDSITETINNNHSIDKSIHQLHETSTRQQTAINTIQATLQTQQKDITDIKTAIVDIRTSINHMIRSVSEIATKLGFEITLPSPLPIYPIPPTPLTTAATNSTAPTPSSPKSLKPLPLCPADLAPQPLAPPPITASAAPFHHLLSLPTMAPSSPVKQYNATHQILKSFSDSHIEFLVGIPDTLHTMSRKQQLKIALNSFDTTKLVGAQIAIGCEAVFEQKYRKEETSPNINMLSESTVLVFDPGGTLGVERVFDLEDKVVFEGLVMIRSIDASIEQHSNPTQMHKAIQVQHSRPKRISCYHLDFRNKLHTF